MKYTSTVKSFKELAKIVPKGLYKPLQPPYKPPIITYHLVDAERPIESLVAYSTKNKDDPVLLSKMQTLRQKNKIHWIDIQESCND